MLFLMNIILECISTCAGFFCLPVSTFSVMYIFVYVIFEWPYLSKHLVQQKCKQLIFLWAAVYTHIFLIFYQWSF